MNRYWLIVLLFMLGACSSRVDECLTAICKRPLSNEEFMVVWLPEHHSGNDYIKVNMKDTSF